MTIRTLQEIWADLAAQGYESDKGSVHSYIPVYEEILAPYRGGRMLEIGLFNGHSLRMWEQYFSEAWGIDCDEQPHGGMADLRPMMGTHNIKIMDAESESCLQQFDRKFDVIIEDAGHDPEQQLKIYGNFKQLLSPGGIYIIEDIQDIDWNREIFGALGKIVDLRNIKGRYDDILVIIKND